MSRISIRQAQQAQITPNVVSYEYLQGEGVSNFRLYPNPGFVAYGEGNECRELLVIPSGLEIVAVIEKDIYAVTDLGNEDRETTIFTLGITSQKYINNFPYRKRFNLIDSIEKVAGTNNEVKFEPQYVNFTTPKISPPNTTLTLEIPEETEHEDEDNVWKELYVTGYVYSTNGYESYRLPGIAVTANLSFSLNELINGEATIPNAIRSLGEPEKVVLIDVGQTVTFRERINAAPTEWYNNLPIVFRGKPFLKSVRDWYVEWYGTGYLYQRGNIYAIRQIKIARFRNGIPNAPGRNYPYEHEEYAQVRITEPTAYTRNITFNQYSGETKSLSTQWKVSNLDVGLISRDFTVPATPIIDNVGIEIESSQSLLRSLDTELPRKFSDKTLTTYLLKRSEEIGELQIFAKGPEISIPSNATITHEETTDHSYLKYAGSWDNTFKQSRTRCPSWILYDVLTNEIFGIEINPEQIDIQSFYDVSVYNNELIEGKPRWAFDGILTGNGTQIVEKILDSMNAILQQNENGIWVLSQESPISSKFIIAPNNIVDSKITYRLSTSKPGIVAKFMNRLTGLEEVTPRLEITDIERTYPGQERSCAIRWANWKSFIEKNLLDSIEFTVPWNLSNNNQSVCNFYKLKLFDVVEIHDPLQSGQRTSGRVIKSTSNSITLDTPPLELFDDGIYNNGYVEYNIPNTTILKIQNVDGGIDRITINKLSYNPCDLRDNKLEFNSRDIVPVGSVWAIEHEKIKPRLHRILSISEGNGGLTFTITARPYYDGMHRHIEENTELVIPNYVWNNDCGVNVDDFHGLAENVHRNYSVKFDSIDSIRFDDWNVKMDSMMGVIDNLDNSCNLPES